MTWTPFYDPEPSPLTPPSNLSLSGGLVAEKFSQALTTSNDAWETALALLEQLAAMTYVIPWSAIEFEEPPLTGISNIDPNEPAQPELTTDEIDIPTFTAIPPVMDSVSIYDEDPPSLDIGSPPTATFNWDEVAYTSTLLSELNDKLYNDLVNGGTGLDEDTEQAIWDRARSRQTLEEEESYNQALNMWAAKGFSLPQGTLVGALAEVRNRIDRTTQDLNNDILVQQSKLAQDNTNFIVTSAIEHERNLMANASDFQQRAFTAAKTVVDYAVSLYQVKVESYKTLYEAYKTRADVDIARVGLAVEKLKGEVAVFEAEASRYKTVIDGKIAQAEINTKINESRVDLYKADITKYEADVDALVKAYLAKIEYITAEMEILIKDADMKMRTAIAQYDLQTESVRAAAQVAAQLAASAMGSINASANVGFSEGRQDSTSYNVSEQNSFTQSQQQIQAEYENTNINISG